MAPTADSFLLVIPGLGSCGPGCCRWMYTLTEPQQKALSQALGLHTAGCRLPAPQSLLTLVSGPPLPPLPPFPLLRSGKYIRDRTLEQKLLLLREPE